MANPKCVALKCEVKDVFDSKFEPAVRKQIRETVQKLVDKNKGLTFDDKCKDGWLLTVTVVSLKVDDPNNPTTIEAKVVIDGVPLFGTANGLKATGNTKATGIRAKKLEQEVTMVIKDVVDDLMTKQVIPQMLKP